MGNFIKRLLRFFSCETNNSTARIVYINHQDENSASEKQLAEGFLQNATALKERMKLKSESGKKVLIFTAKVGEAVTKFPIIKAVEIFESMITNDEHTYNNKCSN